MYLQYNTVHGRYLGQDELEACRIFREAKIVGHCCVCGEELYSGEPCFVCGDSLIHRDPYGSADCLWDYLRETYSDEDMAELCGIERMNL